jgi:hypothetical protein
MKLMLGEQMRLLTGLTYMFLMSLPLAIAAKAQPDGVTPSQPAKIKMLNSTLTMGEDGKISRTVHTEFQVLNSAGVLGVSQFPISYSSQLVDVDVNDAYTLKSDGRKLPVDTSAIFTRPQPATAGAPFFNDLMQKVLVFPSVEVGDTLVFDETEHQKQTAFEGQYLDARLFPTTIENDATTFAVSVPSNRVLDIETKDVGVEKKQEGNRTVYTFTHSNPKAVIDTNPQLSTWDRMPRLYISTFRSYDEMGHAYAAIVASKLSVTPKVQALADQLTDGVKDRREQAKRIYNYVSSKIRYVSIAFGTGAIVPHDAETVLNNGYGDCKDKVMLLSALLKAKGIASEPVLVNATNGYTLSGPPTLVQLNHLIAWLPEFHVYVDATVQVASFGILPLEEYGKPVIHAVATGPVQHVIPSVQPGALSISHKTDVTLDETGKLSGTTRVEGTGPFDIRLRLIAIGLQETGGQRTPYAAIHPTFHFNAPELLDTPFSVTGDFSIDPNPRLLTGDGFAPPSGTWIVSRPGGVLMGLITQNTMTGADNTPCYSGHEDEVITVTFPEGRHVIALPTDTEIKNDHLHYSTHWSASGHSLSVRRAFDTTIDQPLCTGKVRKDAAAALAQIRQDYSTQVSLGAN